VERAPFALEMLNISKTFPGVRALDDVTFGCARGEVHALCGENGAGKSTLIKILGGAYQPDCGRILLDGHEVEFSHPVASRRAGVSIIHQELSLLPHRSVAENIFLGIEPTRYGMLDRRKMRDDAERLLCRLGSSIRAETGAGDLSIAQQQLVEIAKALTIDARILVMDEPTAALDRDDAARLLDLVKRLTAGGVSVIYVSHRMPEIKTVANRVTVLKDGRTVMTAPIAVVVIGGTLLAGGRGGVWGTLAGVLLFAVLHASFNMLDVSAYPKLVLRGAVVIAAVAIYTFRSREIAA
jgi:ABC-type sugar transport system ATPase subunit